jgi:outer membrane protein OmpA-like peptidoglycan-associated protein
MKKLSLLILALIVSLPGCGKKQEPAKNPKKNSVEKYMETDVEIDEIDPDDIDMDELTDEDIATFDFNDGDDESEEVSVDEDDDMDDNDIEDGDEFSWINAQADDEFKKLYFTFNHYGVRADQKESLNYDIDQVKQLIAEAGSSAQPTIVIEGHTDQEGSPAYNVGLSEKRAKTVADFFVAAGVDRSVIKVVGRGQECPTIINGKVVDGSRDAREPNRRVEVRVIYT